MDEQRAVTVLREFVIRLEERDVSGSRTTGILNTDPDGSLMSSMH
jgi:hypothetical protein